MSYSTFTDEQRAILAANKYTYKVSKSQISFTKEFKQLFWTDYQSRMSSTQIFIKYGYDPDIIGHNRITGFQQTLKKDVERGLDFYDGARPSGMLKDLTSKDEHYANDLQDLEHRVDFLEQEVDFLKKISSAKTSKK